jgi:glycosyltransferase involved in cell wall biosynthesis
MKIRIVDYNANLGGVARFTVELLRVLISRPGVTFEVVSHGVPLQRYRGLLSGVMPVQFQDIPPRHPWREKTLLAGIPGAGPLNWLLGTPVFEFTVKPRALEDCDLAWFPWLHRHRIPWTMADRVVASLHDLIPIDFASKFPRHWSVSEQETVPAWLGSAARIAVSSNATATSLNRLFGTSPGRVSVIPLSGQHAEPLRTAEPRDWPFLGREYLMCPANVSGHKNHEVLIAGASGISARHPLVLTGDGTDLRWKMSDRVRDIRAAARVAGLSFDQSLFAVGYVDDASYYQILASAWALVMPTLAEGGGSFPVWEAMERGIPAVVSDIPVMREMVERAGGQVLWFDPYDPASLSRVLADLEENYAAYLRRAKEQTRTMRPRTWHDVAGDYARLMGLPDAKGGRRS